MKISRIAYIFSITFFAVPLSPQARDKLVETRPPPIGTRQMPLVSPEEAASFLSRRVIPPSSVPKTIESRTDAAEPFAFKIPMSLNRELPKTETTPGGLPRSTLPLAVQNSARNENNKLPGSRAKTDSQAP